MQKERNAFVGNLQIMARDQGIRVTFVTGDVHCAAVGLFKTLVPGKKASPISPEQDYRYMLDVTTSELCHYSHCVSNKLRFHQQGAIVNTP